MATRIEGVATARSGGGRFRMDALALAQRAALACLARAGRSPNELDLLINAGIYRKGSLAEPALAALIQEDIGANPGDPPVGGRGTFSFDVNGGGCGVLTGIHLVDGMLSSGSADVGMVVASDSDPDPGSTRGFDFPWAGGAVLLGPSQNGEGFSAFRFASFPEYEDVFKSRIAWEEGSSRRLPGRPTGRNVLELKEQANYAELCVACAGKTIDRFLDEIGLPLERVDLVVSSQFPAAFPDALAERLAFPSNRVARVPAELAAAHTAGPLAALEAALETGLFQSARNTLFVTVGSGIGVGLALYGQARGS